MYVAFRQPRIGAEQVGVGRAKGRFNGLKFRLARGPVFPDRQSIEYCERAPEDGPAAPPLPDHLFVCLCVRTRRPCPGSNLPHSTASLPLTAPNLRDVPSMVVILFAVMRTSSIPYQSRPAQRG